MLNLYPPIPKQPAPLPKKTLDIWQFSLKDSCLLHEEAYLSADEKVRAARFHFAHHQHRFKISRVRLREILAMYLNKNPATLHFQYHTHGKPYLENALQFNLTHSKDLALLAICHYPVGIDLEFYSARPFLNMGKNIFSTSENNTLKHLPDALKPLCFFHLWAQKEAVVKAVGLGLTYPTERIDVPTLPSTFQHQHTTIDNQHWKIDTFSPKLAARAAVCYHPEITHIRKGIYSHEH